MSVEPSSPPAADSTAASKPPRNPVERVVVWVLIIGLLAVAGNEAAARFGYTRSLNNLQAALAADEQGDVLTKDEVPTHISGFPAREEDAERRLITYTWSGLLKTYGSIRMPYSPDQEILGLLTSEAPPEPKPNVVIPEDETPEDDLAIAHSGPGSGGGGGGRGPGGGGGVGGGFDPMQFDADGDGKLSRDEAPERMQERFDEIDTNGDGFADAAELEARRAPRAAQGGPGGERGQRPNRPQRPDEEAEAQQGSTGEQPAAPDEENASQ